MSGRLRYLPGLDGLRAFAVAGVLCYHGSLAWAQGGFLGVDMFFVLSGFLITTLLLQERRDTGGIALARVLDPACPAPPPGALPAHRARRRLRRGRRRAGGAAHDPIRHARDARLRRELAVRLQRELVLRPVPDTVAAPARLVARDRRAVLPDLADDRVRRPAVAERIDARARRRRRRHARRIGRC